VIDMPSASKLIEVCPLCQKKQLTIDNGTITCAGCGSGFELTSDHRQATLKVTLTDSRVPGWKNGTTLLSVPNMSLVEKTVAIGTGGVAIE
jgi:hypothetical protein